MNTSPRALSIEHSVTVTASAGSGKTWLLISRLVRLLISGTAPDAILAITFTRKAAAEMATRLRERLYVLAHANPDERTDILREMGIEPSPELLDSAATLYERYLFDIHQVRVTTFHAFCQELLRRFPLEADVPAGFEVLESSRQLQEAAWDALVDDATRAPDDTIALALQTLFETFNGHHEAKAALMRFLHHRSDWWAYVHGQDAPLEYSVQNLASQLAINPDANPLDDFFNTEICGALQDFYELLQLHATDTNLKHAECLGRALNQSRPQEERLIDLRSAFFTQKGERLKRKSSKKMGEVMGEGRMQRLLDLHDQLCGSIEDLLDILRRHATLALSTAWYRGGIQLLKHYQRLKTEQRTLDFSDLEWKAYLLLNHADHAMWVQYKLDRRIEHLLIDEFQDTNPTQWHLIYPLLQELAASDTQRQRTVFLVGDAKQSIYRFRRAEPELFPAARQWLHEHLNATEHTLSASWRSSPAIINFVNQIFGAGTLYDLLPEFHPHSTHREALWGKVEMLPLIPAEEPSMPLADDLRNPLHQPRLLSQDLRHRQEGELIATRIRELMAQQTSIGLNHEARELRYDDIMILVRKRTHVYAYEQALRTAAIPYTTASRGTLLDCIEIQDMVALLNILMMPFNNLALVTVLRSPLFACSDEDLMRLAEVAGENWLERLLNLAPQLEQGSPLARAADCIPRWKTLAGQRPVHDLLDRIYSEGNVVARYQAAFPAHLRPRLRANLTRFIELALDMDSGRYPSLTAFLNRLETLRSLEDDAPDESSESTLAGSVRLLTIHAAKGLESPVVFLAGAAAASPSSRGHRVIVRWPAQANQPSHFLLCERLSEADRMSAELLADEDRKAQQEQANLLYVAVTRAKQLLFISGCQPRRGEDLGWYGTIAAQLGDIAEIAAQGWHTSHGEMSTVVSTPPPSPTPPRLITGLNTPVPYLPGDSEIAPSRGTDVAMEDIESGDDEGRIRGIAIHRFLQLLSQGECTGTDLLQRVSNEMKLDNAQTASAWLAEAEHIVQHPKLREWFDAERYECAYNEVPIYYDQNGRLVHGIVDRLVINQDGCTIIDYKTHRQADYPALAAVYQEQMHLYVEGIKRLWPDKTVRAYLLFTADATAVEWQAAN